MLALAALAFWAPSAAAVAIESPGPVTSITLHDGALPFSCEVHYDGSLRSEFFGANACGTFLLVDGAKYGPGNLPFAESACPCKPYAVTQATRVAGNGTPAAPLTVALTARAGPILMRESAAYVVGNHSYTTNVTLTNRGPAPAAGILWRAADCVVAGMDHAYGWLDPAWPGAVACASEATGGDRLIEWRPLTPGSKHAEGDFRDVWAHIGANASFADTCDCGQVRDAAAGLSWTWTLAPGESRSFRHETHFRRTVAPVEPAPTAPTSTSAAPATPPPPGPPPVANFRFDASHVSCEDSRIRFQASPNTRPVTWHWDFGDGQVATESEPVHVFAAAGSYAVRLTVTDLDGRLAQAARTVVSVGDPNCCPVLDPLPERSGREGETLRFAVPVHDFEGDGLAFTLEGLPASAAVMAPGKGESFPQFTWPVANGQAGEYHVQMHATDGRSPGCDATQEFHLRILVATPQPVGPDGDSDGVGDAGDNCPGVPNTDQADADGDFEGDACDASPKGPDGAIDPALAQTMRDVDRDGIPDVTDNCMQMANRGQVDIDGDATGDACDLDVDGDGVGNGADNCPLVPNPTQQDDDADGNGDACKALAGRAQATLQQASADARGQAAPGRNQWVGLVLALAGGAIGAALLVALVLRRALR